MMASAIAATIAEGGILALSSLRGGMDDTTPPTLLADDQCTNATNVEFFASPLGERRGGTVSLSITGAGFGGLTGIVHLSEWFPTGDPTVPEGWAIAATAGSSVVMARHTVTPNQWNAVTPSDAITTTSPGIYQITTMPLAGSVPLKFWAYPSSVDRLHVWDTDTSTLRRVGLAQPAAPTAADTGSGTFATVRYYRVRFTQQTVNTSAGTTMRRSEPSTVLTFTPSGSGSGAVVTMPALLSEGETHWELEASTDNTNFYLLATTAVATTTYTDTTVYATGYSAGTVSEVIGTYILPPSARYLATDGDRLLLAGHYSTVAKQSTVWWTPTYTAPGVGNSERIPTTVNSFLNVDNGAGGIITGIGSGVYGTVYLFKWSRAYAMVRTNNATTAYDIITLSETIGALSGSVFVGNDENGSPCVYFLDPNVGPCRVGPSGIQQIYGLKTTWKRVNLNATVPACGMHYPFKDQAIWYVAVDGSSFPTLKILVQVNELRPGKEHNQVHRGLSLGDGTSASVTCCASLTESSFVNNTTVLYKRPYIGQTSPQYIQRTDISNISTDNGNAFTAKITTRPFMSGDLSQQWGVLSGRLMALADPTATVKITLIRDFGIESKATTVTLAASSAGETYTLPILDAMTMSEISALQIKFSD